MKTLCRKTENKKKTVVNEIRLTMKRLLCKETFNERLTNNFDVRMAV